MERTSPPPRRRLFSAPPGLEIEEPEALVQRAELAQRPPPREPDPPAFTPPPAEIVARALGRLEAFASHPGTLDLHDPLYGLRADPGPAPLAALSAALARHPSHPLHAELTALLGPWLEARPLTLADVLLEDGPLPPDADPVHETRRRLRRAREARRILEDRVALLEQQAGRLSRLSDAMAAAGALLAIFALLGWLGALGVLPIEWLLPPEIEPPPGEETEERPP